MVECQNRNDHIVFERWCMPKKQEYDGPNDDRLIHCSAANAFSGVSKAETFARAPCPTKWLPSMPTSD